MKNLILTVSLVISGSIIGFSQSHNDTLEKWYNENRIAVEKEFVRLIDSARSNLTIKKQFIYRSSDGLSQKELKSIKQGEKSKGSDCQVVKQSKGNKINFIIVSKQVPVIPIKYDSILSLASNHHAKYLVEMAFGATHGEWKEYDGYTYNGDLPILRVPSDRVKYYCPNRVYVAECLSKGIVGHIATFKSCAAKNYWVKNIDHINVKSVSNLFFKAFKNSKDHWNIFMKSEDIGLMGVSFVMDFNNGEMSFVTVIGNDKDTIKIGLFANE